MSTTDLTAAVVDRVTGEAIDLREAPLARLARFVTDVGDWRGELTDHLAAVNREIVRRLDADLKREVSVTDHEDGKTRTITVPAPEGGTVTEPSLLEPELVKLIERGVLTVEGAAVALQRRVTLEVEVPIGTDLGELLGRINGAEETKVAGVAVVLVKATASRKVMKRGLDKLAKLEGTGAALKRARRHVSAGDRLPKIALKP